MKRVAWISLALAGLLVAGLWVRRSAADTPAVATPATDTPATDTPATPVTDGTPPAATLPLPDLPYGARQGRALFQYYCSTCHGSEGTGAGFNSYNLDPKPRDLTDPAFQSQRTDVELTTVIRSGGGIAGLSTAMPPWGHTLNDRQIGYLVQYIRTLAAKPDDQAGGS